MTLSAPPPAERVCTERRLSRPLLDVVSRDDHSNVRATTTSSTSCGRGLDERDGEADRDGGSDRARPACCGSSTARSRASPSSASWIKLGFHRIDFSFLSFATRSLKVPTSIAFAHHSRKYLQDTDRQRQRGREAVCGGTGWRRGSECERDWSRALLRCVPLRLCAATVPCCMSTQRLLKNILVITVH